MACCSGTKRASPRSRNQRTVNAVRKCLTFSNLIAGGGCRPPLRSSEQSGATRRDEQQAPGDEHHRDDDQQHAAQARVFVQHSPGSSHFTRARLQQSRRLGEATLRPERQNLPASPNRPTRRPRNVPAVRARPVARQR